MDGHRPRPTAFGLVALALALGVGGSAAQEATPVVDLTGFLATVDHPLVPLASVRVKLFVGEERDDETGETIVTRVEERVLAETEQVAGIEVAVVEVKEYEDDELVELTLDYYAQAPDGTVYYMGERVDDYEDGQVVGNSGQWLTGEGGNQPGEFMPASIAVGQVFEQERVPGIAEDRSTIVALDQTIETAAGAFRDCVETEDVNPLDDSTERKVYCPGVGIVRETGANGQLDLVSFEGGQPATPAPA